MGERTKTEPICGTPQIRGLFPVNYDSKYYEFATTVQPVPGAVSPPDGDRWMFVEMRLSDKVPSNLVALWARQRKP